MSEPTVTDNAAQRRYELHDAGEIGGRLEYEDHRDVRVFTHTRVPGEHEGKGYGSRLAKAARFAVAMRCFVWARPSCSCRTCASRKRRAISCGR